MEHPIAYHFPFLVIKGQKESFVLIEKGEISGEMKAVATGESMGVSSYPFEEEHLVKDAQLLSGQICT